MRGIEPRAFHMQSERSTTELHPHLRPSINEYNINNGQKFSQLVPDGWKLYTIQFLYNLDF